VFVLLGEAEIQYSLPDLIRERPKALQKSRCWIADEGEHKVRTLWQQEPASFQHIKSAFAGSLVPDKGDNRVIFT
jgi:hypothetical protein